MPILYSNIVPSQYKNVAYENRLIKMTANHFQLDIINKTFTLSFGYYKPNFSVRSVSFFSTHFSSAV